MNFLGRNRTPQERIFALFFMASVFTAGYLFSRLTTAVIPQSYALRANTENYKYVNPLLACPDNNSTLFEEFKTLKNKIESLTTASRQAGQILDASVYFRDPRNGRWIGMNEEKIYSPASLLKVPLMMALLKQAEKTPVLLQKTFLYKKNPTQVMPLIETPLLRDDTRYTTEDLIKGMIIDSDNDAKDILVSAVDPQILAQTYAELGIETPYDIFGGNSTLEYHISAKTYALFFRVLYNATYLSREMSEKALGILAQTKFPKGLRAGIPMTTEIAHKYGVRVLDQNNKQIIELSDCGMVYNLEPYLLCIMTKGTNVHELAAYITSIAATVDYAMRTDQAAVR